MPFGWAHVSKNISSYAFQLWSIHWLKICWFYEIQDKMRSEILNIKFLKKQLIIANSHLQAKITTQNTEFIKNNTVVNSGKQQFKGNESIIIRQKKWSQSFPYLKALFVSFFYSVMNYCTLKAFKNNVWSNHSFLS